MEVMIIIFIVVALIIGLFCMFAVGRDIVIEEKDRRQKRNAAQATQAVEQTAMTTTEPATQAVEEIATATTEPATQAVEQTATATAEPVTQAVEEIATATTAEPTTQAVEETATTDESATQTVELSENTIAFSTSSTTLEERYLELSPECKGYYDEIVRCAMAVEGSKRYKNANTEEYKVGRNSLVKIKIRRGVIICELVIPNLTFKNYINDNKLAVRQAPAVIKVTDEASLSAVKDSIGIAVKAIEEEKAYKKEQAKLRRRQNYAAARETAEQPND